MYAVEFKSLIQLLLLGEREGEGCGWYCQEDVLTETSTEVQCELNLETSIDFCKEPAIHSKVKSAAGFSYFET